MEEKNKKQEKINNLSKMNVIQNIENIRIIQTEKQEKENDCVKILLGLELIKKYFISERNLKEKNDLINYFFETPDYLNFKSFLLKNSKDNKSSRENILKLKYVSSLNSLNSRSTTASAPRYNKKIDLQENFNNLDLKYEDLENLSTFLINKRRFYHNNIINFNSICFQLESKKELFTKRVNEIFIRNYQNFNEFRRNNSRLDNFINKNKAFNMEYIVNKNYKFDLHDNFIEYKNKFLQLFDEINYFINSNFTFPKNCKTDSNDIQKEFFILEAKYQNFEKNYKKIHKTDISRLINQISNFYLKLVLNSDNLDLFYKDIRAKRFTYEEIEELKKYFESNSELFFSIEKLKFENLHFINLSKLNDIGEIISSIVKVIDLYKNYDQNIDIIKEISSNTITKSFNPRNKKGSISAN